MPRRGPDEGIRNTNPRDLPDARSVAGNGARDVDDAKVAQEHLDDVALLGVANTCLHFYPGHDADQAVTVSTELRLSSLDALQVVDQDVRVEERLQDQPRSRSTHSLRSRSW